jgi:hypothetical protein
VSDVLGHCIKERKDRGEIEAGVVRVHIPVEDIHVAECRNSTKQARIFKNINTGINKT